MDETRTYRDLMDNHFRFTDAGRKYSKRPRQKDDCTVRAMALAFGLDYDIAYDHLAHCGRKSHRRFHLGKHLDKHKQTGLLNHTVESISFPAVKGQPRMNVGAFVKRFSRGTFIIKIAKHVATVRDGVLLDDDARWYKCVYKAWKIQQSPAGSALEKWMEKWDVPQV